MDREIRSVIRRLESLPTETLQEIQTEIRGILRLRNAEKIPDLWWDVAGESACAYLDTETDYALCGHNWAYLCVSRTKDRSKNPCPTCSGCQREIFRRYDFEID